MYNHGHNQSLSCPPRLLLAGIVVLSVVPRVAGGRDLVPGVGRRDGIPARGAGPSNQRAPLPVNKQHRIYNRSHIHLLSCCHILACCT